VTTNDYRPIGQAVFDEKAQLIASRELRRHKILWELPTIPGELPKIADVLRTTAEEKGLTLERTG
jgi:hypothetical protein